ncbi:MAG: helix-turn-helix transcriptional regulator [Gemmataceae bacterium]
MMTTRIDRPTNPPQLKLLTASEACSALGVSLPTFKHWQREYPDFPAPRKLGARSYWLAIELIEWVKRQPAEGEHNDG